MPAILQKEKILKGIVRALQTEDMKPSEQLGKSKVKKIKKENLDGGISTLYMVKKPYAGCQLTSLVEPIDPLLGIGAGHEIVPDQVHGVYADQDQADMVANELYETYCQEESMLEEKKGQVGEKIKKAIDQLEKKHKEHINLSTQDPKNASKHKQHIAKITHQIDDLMTKLEKIEKSKKEIKKDEDKKDIKEGFLGFGKKKSPEEQAEWDAAKAEADKINSDPRNADNKVSVKDMLKFNKKHNFSEANKKSSGKINSSGMGNSKAAKAVGKWAESKGLSQDDFDELDMLLDDWFTERTDELDAGSDW
jgi:hypothetical protein